MFCSIPGSYCNNPPAFRTEVPDDALTHNGLESLIKVLKQPTLPAAVLPYEDVLRSDAAERVFAYSKNRRCHWTWSPGGSITMVFP